MVHDLKGQNYINYDREENLKKVYRTNLESGLKKTGAGSECDQNG
jgi:hypothetical protein